MKDKYIFGVDIGGTAVKIGLFSECGQLITKWEIETRRANSGAEVPKDIADAIAKKCEELSITKPQILGIGLGVPGPVRKDGFVSHCPNLGWRDKNVNREMEELTGIRSIAANDANVAALGEMWKGGGAGYSNVVLVTLGTGVGGGVIVDGEIVFGANGAGGELGHMVMDPEETDCCGCGGYGHLEQYVSATGIVNMTKKKLLSFQGTSCLSDKTPLTAKDIFDAAKEGDSLALSVVDTFGLILARALAHVAAVVEPEAFIIGGGVSKAGDIILQAVKKHYNNGIMKALMDKTFCLATLSNDAGIFGCARMILSQTEE